MRAIFLILVAIAANAVHAQHAALARLPDVARAEAFQFDWKRFDRIELDRTVDAELVSRFTDFLISFTEPEENLDTLAFLRQYLFKTDLNRDGRYELINRGYSLGQTRTRVLDSTGQMLFSMVGEVFDVVETGGRLELYVVQRSIDGSSMENFGVYRIDKRTLRLRSADIYCLDAHTVWPNQISPAKGLNPAQAVSLWNVPLGWAPADGGESLDNLREELGVVDKKARVTGLGSTLIEGRRWHLVAVPYNKHFRVLRPIEENRFSYKRSLYIIGWIPE